MFIFQSFTIIKLLYIDHYIRNYKLSQSENPDIYDPVHLKNYSP